MEASIVVTRFIEYTVTLPQPLSAMLETEARGSGRSPEDHLLHVLDRRYANLIRVCQCGYFLYVASDDLRCSECGRPCCPYDSLPQDNHDLCFTCAEAKGIDTTGKGGFRAAPEGKV